jgi:hypothetical protein
MEFAVLSGDLDLIDYEAALALELYFPHLAGNSGQSSLLGSGPVYLGESLKTLGERLWCPL